MGTLKRIAALLVIGALSVALGAFGPKVQNYVSYGKPHPEITFTVFECVVISSIVPEIEMMQFYGLEKYQYLGALKGLGEAKPDRKAHVEKFLDEVSRLWDSAEYRRNWALECIDAAQKEEARKNDRAA